jgi:beta-1,4-mannosyltransferase
MLDLKGDVSVREFLPFDLTGPWIWYVLAIYLSLPILGYIILPFLANRGGKSSKKSIAVFVLGDLGHSPRMCYHARSFSNLGYSVSLCGYLESDLPEDLIDHPDIDIMPIPVLKNRFNLPFVLFAVQKIVLQVYYLFQLLFQIRGVHYIMIQNPPSIPILVICIVFTKLFSNSKLIIDWHNLNYSILNLRYSNEKHPIVRVAKWYERFFGRFAHLNLTVTKSMKKFLVKEFGFDAKRVVVLYDRPGNQFAPLEDLEYTADEIKLHQMFQDVDMTKDYKIIVSSTSFTPDEDFHVLLDALKLYDQSEKSQPVLLIVTGKGPLKQQFLDTVKNHAYLSKVTVLTAWLAIEDYPMILAIADIGVSLHTSSSGLDLPMKILDFFGCGIPVISLDFPSISELVKNNENGLVCQPTEKGGQSHELFRLLEKVFYDNETTKRIKAGAMNETALRWKTNWNQTLVDIFQ